MDQCDAIIIGFGKGGKTLAGALGNLGKKVSLIEKSEKMYGGTCINVGCIPSKSLVYSAGLSKVMDDGDFTHNLERYAIAVDEKTALVEMLRGKNFDKLNNHPNVTVINADARFVESHVVEVVSKEGKRFMTAPHIFINTGSVSVKPDIKGLEDNPKVFFSDTLMAETVLPKRLTIIGGGYIGLEFASMYAAFGSAVTVLQKGDVFLPREDDDIASEIRGLLEKQNITILTNTIPFEVSTDGSLIYEHDGQTKTLSGDAVLIATGRNPNTEGLNLEAAGIEITARGAVKVDDLLRTTVPGVWAIGDVTGGQQFTYTSLDDFRIIISQLDGTSDYSLLKRKNVPYSVFMKTPLFPRWFE